MPGGKRFFIDVFTKQWGKSWIKFFFLQSFYQNAGSKGESCVKSPNFVQKKIFIYSIRTGVETLQRKSSLKAFTTTNLFLQWLIMIYESLSSTNDYNLLIIFINDWYELWIIISRWLIMIYKSFSLMIDYNLQIIFFNGWLRFANNFLKCGLENRRWRQ